ncbi:MAG: HNH endonuclease, partial [Chloroflexota bacterium]|nr:HNH endonuclease [Chloroflexota bacterium]
YWQRRRQRTGKERLHPKYHWLAWRQHYRCPVCGDWLDNGESIERHHMIRNKHDTARNEQANLRLVHQICHEQIHSGHRPTMSGALIRAA